MNSYYLHMVLYLPSLTIIILLSFVIFTIIDPSTQSYLQYQSPQASFTIHHSPFTIHHSPFNIHHSPFNIHHSPFTIHHSPFTIHHTNTDNLGFQHIHIKLGDILIPALKIRMMSSQEPKDCNNKSNEDADLKKSRLNKLKRDWRERNKDIVNERSRQRYRVKSDRMTELEKKEHRRKKNKQQR